MNTVVKNVFIGLVVVIVAALIWWRTPTPHTEPIPKPVSIDTSSWIILESNNLGIRLKTPPTVNVYSSPDDPNGCNQPLVFGLPELNTVFLMSEYSSCDNRAESNRAVYTSQGEYSTKITVVPIKDEAEIAGFIKSELISNAALLTSEPSLSPTQNCQERQLNSLRTVVTKQAAGDNGTVPVQIITDTCPISPNILTARYSPTHKKLVLFESVYVAAPAGVYRVPEAAHSPSKTVDQNIYDSVEVLR